MTKRLTKRELNDDELERLLEENAGLGHGFPLSPAEFEWKWEALPPGELEWLWEIDHKKDPRLLLPLIYAHRPRETWRHWEDLFERLRFESRSRKTPSYQLTGHQQKLMAATSVVKGLGWTAAKAARYYGVKRKSLETALEPGKHSSLRRGTKQR